MPDIGIITEMPAWFLLFCLAGGGAYAAVLYYKEKKSELSSSLRTGLGIVRFVSVSMIAFLLLSPFIRSTVEEREKPLVIIALDNSRSVVMGPDSVYYRQQFTSSLDELSGELSGKYDVERYLFDEKMEHLNKETSYRSMAGFTGRQTDMSAVFDHIEDIYSNRNLGAIVLAGDGIYNRGINPIYEQKSLDVPVYSVALGDTSVRKDAGIANTRYNRLAFFKNEFPVQVVVNAFMLDGKEAEVSILKEGQKIASEPVSISGQSFSTTVNFLLTASETGLQRYRVNVTTFQGETNILNNSRDIYIEVLDSRNRILLLAAAPHPDVSAIKEAVRANINYEIEDARLSEFSGTLDPYNLVILHQVPYRGFPATELGKELREKNIPHLMIAGTQADFQAWNAWQNGIELQVTPGNFEEAIPSLNRDFTLFTLTDPAADLLTTMPPLIAPFGNYVTGNGVNVLFHQRIGSVTTSRPLVAFASEGAYRWGYVLGDGIWKWRISNYARSQNHNAFNELIAKIVQYLAIREERGRFRIHHESRFLENQEVTFDAELYNESYELVTGPDVEMIIRDEEGNEYPYSFSRTSKGYVLNSGSFPPGKYSYRAIARTGGQSVQSEGGFFVEAVEVESLATVADHDILETISARSGGEMVSARETDDIVSILEAREDIRPVVYEQKRFRELISLTPLLIIILLLLSVEWFIRKRAGSY